MRLSFGTVLGGVFIAAGLLFAGIDCVILYRGWSAYGLDAWDKVTYGLAAATIPWVLVIYPFVWWVLWLRARWRAVGPLVIAGLVYLILIAYSMVGAMGSIASVRGQVIADRQASKESVEALKEQRDRLKAQYAGIPKTRPAGTVQAALQAEQVKPLWEATEQCKEMYGAASRKYCTGVATLQGELEAARKADELVSKIEALSASIDGRKAVGETADPAAATLALWLRRVGVTVEERETGQGLPIATPAVLLIGELFFVTVGLMMVGLDHRQLVTAHVVLQTPRPRPLVADGEAVAGVAAAPALPPPNRDALTRGRELAVWFFAECVRPVPSGGLEEERWYRLYTAECERSRDTPISTEDFRSMARDAGAVVTIVNGQAFYERILPMMPREGAA